MTLSTCKNGVRIAYTLAETSLGLVLVAATGKGVCAIQLGEPAEDLVDELQARFPKAELVEDDASLGSFVRQVIEFIEAPSKGLSIPLDVGGTAFQKRVWDALRAIPPGSTATYEEIAERVGSPRATRAVGTACAVNKIALAIPCHRVVRKDKGLGGYRWGVGIKQKLLDREQE